MRSGVCLVLALRACDFHALSATSSAAADDASSGSLDSSASVVPFCDRNDATLVACFEFENEVVDHSAHALTTATTSVTYAPGEVGMAMKFGASGAADVDDSPVLSVGSITIELWIQPAALMASQANLLDCDSRYALILQNNNQLHCTLTNHAGINGTLAQLAVGRWTHVACTFDATTGNEVLYADGAQIMQFRDKPGPLQLNGTTGLSIAANNPPSVSDRATLRRPGRPTPGLRGRAHRAADLPGRRQAHVSVIRTTRVA